MLAWACCLSERLGSNSQLNAVPVDVVWRVVETLRSSEWISPWISPRNTWEVVLPRELAPEPEPEPEPELELTSSSSYWPLDWMAVPGPVTPEPELEPEPEELLELDATHELETSIEIEKEEGGDDDCDESRRTVAPASSGAETGDGKLS